MNIDRCVCYKKKFSSLLDVARQGGYHTVRELQDHCEFGTKCKICLPYVEECLKTGKVSFDYIIQKKERTDEMNQEDCHFNIQTNVKQIKFKKTRKEAVLPEYKTSGAAGFDLCACLFDDLNELYKGNTQQNTFYSKNENGNLTKSVKVTSGDWLLIPTGLACEIPRGWQIEIRSRSGSALKYGMVVAQGVGTIDSDYRGEIGVIIKNQLQYDLTIYHGDRIAQGVIMPAFQFDIKEVSELSDTDRGAGGFGSTGN